MDQVKDAASGQVGGAGEGIQDCQIIKKKIKHFEIFFSFSFVFLVFVSFFFGHVKK